MTVRHVVCQIRPPREDDPGQVSDGFYIIEHGELIMTGPDGTPVHESLYRHRLSAGDNAEAIARAYAKAVRRALLGLSETEENFRRPLAYPARGLA